MLRKWREAYHWFMWSYHEWLYTLHYDDKVKRTRHLHKYLDHMCDYYDMKKKGSWKRGGL